MHIRGWLVASASTTPATRPEDGSLASGTSAAGSRARARPTTTPRPGSGTPAPGDPETPVLADADLRDRIVFVAGKASRCSDPRHRAVPLGVKAARALDRYLRERRRHPYVDTPRLWLGSRARPTLDADGVKAMLKRRGADAGITDLHPHAFRHTWAYAFRAAGESRAT